MFERVIRLLVDLSVRFITNPYYQKNPLNFSPFIDAIMESDTKDTFVGTTLGRLVNVSKALGKKTLLLAQSICHTIKKLHQYRQEEKHVILNQEQYQERIHPGQLAIFWIKEYFNIQGWQNDPRCLYSINEICKVCIALQIHDFVIYHLRDRDELRYLTYFNLFY